MLQRPMSPRPKSSTSKFLMKMAFTNSLKILDQHRLKLLLHHLQMAKENRRSDRLRMLLNSMCSQDFDLSVLEM